MHVEINDKFAAKERLRNFCNIGEIAKVTDVAEDGMITFVFDDCEEEGIFKRTGSMDAVTFERYFEKVEEENKVLTVTEEQIDEILEHSEFEVYTTFDKCTVVSCRLPNGFVIVESSACVNPENYDEDLGVDICIDKIANKVWELEGYRLQNETHKWDEEDEEVDCENCDDYDCPENPHYCS